MPGGEEFIVWGFTAILLDRIFDSARLDRAWDIKDASGTRLRGIKTGWNKCLTSGYRAHIGAADSLNEATYRTYFHP